MRTARMAWMAVAAVATLAGCAGYGYERVDCAAGRYAGWTDHEWVPTTPRLDCTMGDSVNTAIARQVLDKDAAIRNARKDVAGMDGSAARDAVFNYQKSFRAPEPAPITFTIGGGSGGQ
jgi:hypothetical protein